MIIYIHGFGSSGEGDKARKFRDYFKQYNIPIIAPSLSYVPQLAISTLEQLIESYEDVSLIGSSLGGYYSIYLAEKYYLNALLINPAVRSAKTLKRLVNKKGLVCNYYDGSYFEWNESHIDMLSRYYVQNPQYGNYLILLLTGDNVLDYREVLEKLPHAKSIVEEGGSHSFDGIERHFERSREFLC